MKEFEGFFIELVKYLFEHCICSTLCTFYIHPLKLPKHPTYLVTKDQPKEEPNFEPSGLLALEDNAKNGIPLKYTVPNEARRPATKWRLYVFPKTANEAAKVIPIHKHVGYLFGKDRRIVDVPTDHPTCSKQHAVLHYRAGMGGVVKPYIMDLESVNGCLGAVNTALILRGVDVSLAPAFYSYHWLPLCCHYN